MRAILLIFSVSLIALGTSNLTGFPGRWNMRKMCLTCMPKSFLRISVEEKLQRVFHHVFGIIKKIPSAGMHMTVALQ